MKKPAKRRPTCTVKKKIVPNNSNFSNNFNNKEELTKSQMRAMIKQAVENTK